MKKLAIGFFAGVLSFLFVSDIVRIASDYAKEGSLLEKAGYFVQDPSVGIWKPFSGRCTKELRRGKYPMRDYFGCNYVQNKVSDLIYKR